MARRSHSPRSAARSDSRSPPRHKKSSPVSGKSRRSHRSRTPGRSRSEGRTKHDRSSTRRHRSKSRSSRRDRKRRDKSSSVSRSRERDRPSRRSTNDRHGNETTRPQSLLVRNLNPKTTGDDLRRAFSRRPGDIRDVYIPKDHSTNELRTFAFVEYDNVTTMEKMSRVIMFCLFFVGFAMHVKLEKSSTKWIAQLWTATKSRYYLHSSGGKHRIKCAILSRSKLLKVITTETAIS